MAVAMFMRYPGVTPEQYDLLMQAFHLDADPPAGEMLHLAAEAGEDGLRVADIWRTKEAAEHFVEHRLRPALAELGIPSELEYEILPLHNAYAPDLDGLERMAALSLPGVSAGTPL
jgi:hypothetical protein